MLTMRVKTVIIAATYLLASSSIAYKINIDVSKVNAANILITKNKQNVTNIKKDALNNIFVPKELIKIFSTVNVNSNQKSIRKFPYPYRAMIAIASDADNDTPEKFVVYHRFLNTKEKTNYGTGLGLDVGDSMWMFMGNDSKKPVDILHNGMQHVMTYFKGTSLNKHDADFIIKYFKAGWIDSIHTFGDFSRVSSTKITFKRQLAIEAWDAMKKAGIYPTVWINHGNTYNVQNFGGTSYGMTFHYQKGDLKGSPYYHTDLTIKNGIKFVWDSIGETNFGIDNPLFEIKLRDGQKVWGFHRYTDDIHYENGRRRLSVISWTWSAGALQKQITPKRLNDIVSKNQYAIVGQHLGGTNEVFPFWYAGIQDLKTLAAYQNHGKLLVARTSRLLNYSLTQQYLKYKIVNYAGQTWINIISVNDPVFGTKAPTLNDVRGITFYLDNGGNNSSNINNSKPNNVNNNDLKPIDPNKIHILINLKPIPLNEVQINPYDNIKGYNNKQSIGIKWFKPDYIDYTKTKGLKK